MDIQPSWAVFWQQQRQQGHCQHILVAGHSSHCSGAQGCLKQQFCHSHRVKFCLHCWEPLRHLVQTIHCLGRRELGAADVLVHPSLLWAAAARGCFTETRECIHFLLPLPPAPCQQPNHPVRGAAGHFFCSPFVLTYYLDLCL